jgi:hypothetical protein
LDNDSDTEALSAVARIETWHGDSLRDVTLVVVPTSLLVQVTDYANGENSTSLDASVRDSLELAASRLPSTERHTLSEIDPPLREYVAAVALRALGTEIVPNVILRDQLK